MDLMQISSDLRSVPDAALQRELTQPSGMVPSYLVLAEAQRRSLMRQAQQQQQAQRQTQSGSVYDETLRSLLQKPPAGPPPPAGMVPPPNGQPNAAMGSTPPQNFRTPMAMAEGGDVEDDTPATIDNAIDHYSQQEGVDPDFARAIWHAEGHGGANTISPRGAIGPFQLMPGTARDLGVDPRDPIQNVHGGIRYIRQLQDQFNGDMPTVAGAYNAGPNAVVRHGGIPPYPETQGYVQRVMKMYGPQGSGLPASSGAGLPKGPMSIYDPDTGDDTPVGTTTGGPPRPFTTPPPASTPDVASMAAPSAFGTEPLGPMFATPPPAAPPAGVAASNAPSPMPAIPTDPWSPENVKAKRDAIAALYGGTDHSALRAEIARLQQQAQQLRKPNWWEMLRDFGFGMAASPSHFAGVAIGAGGLNMAKGMNERQDEARKLQLQALGVDSKLDDEVQRHQDAINQATIRAVDQASQHDWQRQGQSFNDLLKVPGAHYGQAPGAGSPAPEGFAFTANPADPRFGVWTPPQQKKVSADALPFMPWNPTTNQPYAAGDQAPWLDVSNAETAALKAKEAKAKQRPTMADNATSLGIGQTFAAHPDYAAPQNPDGTPRTDLHINDLPAELRSEAQWRATIAREGWTDKNVKGLATDPNAPADLAAHAKAIQANTAAQAGARTTATEKAKQGAVQALPGGPELSTAGQNQMREQGVVGNQFDQLIQRLEPYKANNNPMTLLGPLGKYKLGMVTPEGELGNDISNLSLASIQGMMPFASKSRNYNFIKDIRQHLPNLTGFPPDSPANIYDKLLKARRNFLRMDLNTMKFEQKHGTANPTAPMIDDARAGVYLRLAGGDPNRAMQMAQEDGWGVSQ